MVELGQGELDSDKIGGSTAAIRSQLADWRPGVAV